MSCRRAWEALQVSATLERLVPIHVDEGGKLGHDVVVGLLLLRARGDELGVDVLQLRLVLRHELGFVGMVRLDLSFGAVLVQRRGVPVANLDELLDAARIDAQLGLLGGLECHRSEVFTDRVDRRWQILADRLDRMGREGLREECRIVGKLDREVARVVPGDDDRRTAECLAGDLTKCCQLFWGECEARLADDLVLVAFGTPTTGPLTAHVVRRGAMRVELMQRSQERTLPGLVLPDHAGERIEQLDLARVLDISKLPHTERFQLHGGLLSVSRPRILYVFAVSPQGSWTVV